MIRCKDLVCANVEENGKKIAKTAEFHKTYFQFPGNAGTEDRDKQFNGAVIGKITVPKGDAPTDEKTVDHLFKEMLDFFRAKYEKVNPKLSVMELVTAAFDISERAPVAVALRPQKPLDETKVYETTAKNFAQMGGILDPVTGNKVTDIPGIIAVLKAMSGK